MPSDGAVKTKFDSIYELLGNIEGELLMIAAGLAVLFIIIGGVRYITSTGNPDRIAAARKTITYAVTGLVIVLLYRVVRTVLENIIKVTV